MTDAVEVHFFAAARAAAGTSSASCTSGTLDEITSALVVQFPDLAGVLPLCSYLVDEVAVHGDPAAIHLAPGSRLDVLPPFAGG